MGKKKSATLIVLITVILAALLFISVTPSFYVNATQKFTSLLSTVNLGADMGGGYSVVYYPEHVISGDEYAGLVANYKATQETTDPEDDVPDPAEKYTAHKGVYLSKEIMNDTEVTEEFQENFDSTYRTLKARFEHKNFTDYSVYLQDDYTIRVKVPDINEKEAVGEMFAKIAYAGGLVFSDTATSESSKNVLMAGDAEHIKKATVRDFGDQGYGIEISFTQKGRAEFAKLTEEMAKNGGGQQAPTLYIYVGTEVLMQAGITQKLDQPSVFIGGSDGRHVSYPSRDSAETVAAVINSVLDEENIIPLRLDASRIEKFEPTMGANIALITAIVIGVAILAMCVYSIIRYKGMGLAHVYGFLTYALMLVLCISLIDAVTVSMAGVIGIIFTSVLMCGFNFYAYRNIRDEFETGKTLTAAIKSGYKKSLALTIDTHAVLFLIELALYLIAVGPVRYMGLILIFGTLLSAACTLVVSRFCLYLFTSLSKNKIAFCNFKREETEDE